MPVSEDVDVLLSQLAPYDAKLRPPDLRNRMVQRRVLSQKTIERTDIVGPFVPGKGWMPIRVRARAFPVECSTTYPRRMALSSGSAVRRSSNVRIRILSSMTRKLAKEWREI